jgi:hypothetical protein
MKRIFIALLSGLLPACATVGNAESLVEVAVVSRTTGARIPVWNHQGRLYIAGSPGEKYSVLVSNRTGARVLAVVSIDGVNVITGETATPAQSGYVLDPRGRVNIGGWRKSMSEIAAFVFTAVPDSYAARTGRPGNVGVIGVAAFREYREPRRRPPSISPQPYSGLGSRSDDTRESASGTPASPESNQALRKSEEKLGTGHGERETSQVRYTEFRRATSYPSQLVSIFYDSHANLLARGIIPDTLLTEPNPFPAFRFAPDPLG